MAKEYWGWRPSMRECHKGTSIGFSDGILSIHRHVSTRDHAQTCTKNQQRNIRTLVVLLSSFQRSAQSLDTQVYKKSAMTLLRFGHIHTQKKKVDFIKKIQTLEREQKQKRKSDREGKLETNLKEKEERGKEMSGLQKEL